MSARNPQFPVRKTLSSIKKCGNRHNTDCRTDKFHLGIGYVPVRPNGRVLELVSQFSEIQNQILYAVAKKPVIMNLDTIQNKESGTGRVLFMSGDIPEKAKKLPENAATELNGLNPYQEEELSDVAEQQRLRNMGITKEMSMIELYMESKKTGRKKA